MVRHETLVATMVLVMTFDVADAVIIAFTIGFCLGLWCAYRRMALLLERR